MSLQKTIRILIILNAHILQFYLYQLKCRIIGCDAQCGKSKLCTTKKVLSSVVTLNVENVHYVTTTMTCHRLWRSMWKMYIMLRQKCPIIGCDAQCGKCTLSYDKKWSIIGCDAQCGKCTLSYDKKKSYHRLWCGKCTFSYDNIPANSLTEECTCRPISICFTMYSWYCIRI